MSIQMRRGANEEFDPGKMLPGELAVTTDGTRKVYAAFSAGDVKELASKEEVEKAVTDGIEKINNSGEKQVKSVEEAGAAQVSSVQEAAAGIIADREQITKNKNSIGELKADLSANKKSINELNDKKITKFYSSNLGETALNDSDNGKIQDMMLYGKSLQDGTPTPDTPVEIKSVVNPVVKVCGKNLCDGITQNYWINGSGTVCGVSENNTGLIIDVSNNSIITISSKVIQERYRTCFINDLLEINTDTSNIYGAAIKNGTSDSITMATNGYKYLVVDATDLSSIQVEIGNKATEYEPYKEQTATLPYTLNAIPVSSGGNVTIDGQQYIADYVDIKNKKLWKYVYYGLLSDLTYSVGFSVDSKWYNSSLSTSFELNPVSYNGHKFKENEEIIGLCSKLKSYSFETFYNKGIENGIMNSKSYFVVNLSISLGIDTVDKFNEWAKGVYITKPFVTPYSIDLTDEEVQAFKELATYYPTTNVMVTSDQLDGYTTFNYPISMANGWNYVKEQLGDTRDYIYDMDLQSAEAYVNSEYAVTLTELGV